MLLWPLWNPEDLPSQASLQTRITYWPTYKSSWKWENQCKTCTQRGKLTMGREIWALLDWGTSQDVPWSKANTKENEGWNQEGKAKHKEKTVHPHKPANEYKRNHYYTCKWRITSSIPQEMNGHVILSWALHTKKAEDTLTTGSELHSKWRCLVSWLGEFPLRPEHQLEWNGP